MPTPHLRRNSGRLPESVLLEIIDDLKKKGVAFEIGKEADENMSGFDSVIKAYIPADNAKKYEKQGVWIKTNMGLERVGGHGTTAALAMLNDAVKKGGVMASSHVGGLSGAFIPVSEDAGMIAAVERGALTLEKLEAMTCVCSVGIDMVVVPGDTTAETISGILADEVAIGVINTKTTALRIIPAPGKKVGDVVEFGGLLGTGPVMPVNPYRCVDFINRGGRIPAPMHSLKN